MWITVSILGAGLVAAVCQPRNFARITSACLHVISSVSSIVALKIDKIYPPELPPASPGVRVRMMKPPNPSSLRRRVAKERKTVEEMIPVQSSSSTDTVS